MPPASGNRAIAVAVGLTTVAKVFCYGSALLLLSAHTRSIAAMG